MKFAEEMTEQQRNETLNEINDTIEGKNNLIVVTQLPIIQEQLAAIKAQFEEAAARAKELECTEENLSEIKRPGQTSPRCLLPWRSAAKKPSAP